MPVPRVAVTTPDFDFVAEDIVLNIRELTPNQMHLETLTRVRDVELERSEFPITTLHIFLLAGRERCVSMAQRG